MISSVVQKKRIKRCEFKGCRKTETDCVIKNHGCPEHCEIMKNRGNENKKSWIAKNNAFKRMKVDFEINQRINSSEFIKLNSFMNSIFKTSAIGKGKVMALTELATTPYLALKKYGVTIIENAIMIDDKAHEQFGKYVDNVRNRLEPSFTKLTKGNKPKFITNGQPNRFVMSIPKEDEHFFGWNDIQCQFDEMLDNLDMPVPKKRDSNDDNFDCHYSLLLTEPKMDKRQQEHTDVRKQFELGHNTKHFHMIGLTAISKQSFLYVQPVGMKPILVLVEKGDCLLMRDDIPHAGAENHTDYNNVRLHMFVDVLGWNLNVDHGYSIKKVQWNNCPKIVYDKDKFEFNVS